MLKARNLDDQTYEEIVQAAEGRLPWLCPVWTDHNAHDPGITILELMAWYKELQQYHMNQFTDELRCKLLKLAGITRRPAAPARCAVELGPEAPERLEGERLETREEIPFELAEGYAFAKNKGYGTKAHYEGLQAQGMTPIHRRSFLKNLK